MSETTDHQAEAIEQASRTLASTLLRAGSDIAVVSGAQLAALQVIARREPLNLAQLAEELATIPSWASRICDRLEADGYIERRPNDTGRRQVTIKLRAPGRRLLDELHHRRTAALAAVLQSMSPADRQALLRGLEGFTRASQPDEGPATELNASEQSA